MPWIAIYDGQKAAPRQVPKQTDVVCPECGGQMRVWSKSSDGRGRHFKHIKNMGRGGGGGTACESVAESDIHLKWKSLAADRLDDVFEGNVENCEMERQLQAPKSDKDRRFGDAVVTFEQRDPQLGQGVVVEVQHKNESKDIDAATADFIAQDYAVVWTDKADFGTDQWRMAAIDIRARAQEAAWPEQVPEQTVWWQPGQNHRAHRSEWQAAYRELQSVDVPATLPREWHDEQARELWKQQSWHELFPTWVEQGAEEYPAETYRDEVRAGLLDGSEPTIQLPPTVTEPLLFRTISWEKLFESGVELPHVARADISMAIDFAPLIERQTWRKWYRSGVRDRQSKRDDINPPPTGHDDVQCHECESYFYWTDGYEVCQTCGTTIDWEWNVATQRISPESVPEHIEIEFE
ncbi:hypothetical protein NDI56_20965 [Haloarcula sp. S1CR25-12]|uniref:Uncharacterized protein n=1 Tax=Haloarcula saliterrae TaxID=2950534 RepID=A0ABU2FJ69_9EURY|nr:hypothetical protein [Haloarcula sp. S1CR25-12]MDS0261880.1 hypothetical protein [Haloarcula sp. S1CR25-12]